VNRAPRPDISKGSFRRSYVKNRGLDLVKQVQDGGSGSFIVNGGNGGLQLVCAD
jgi:hypothetical protein